MLAAAADAADTSIGTIRLALCTLLSRGGWEHFHLGEPDTWGSLNCWHRCLMKVQDTLSALCYSIVPYNLCLSGHTTYRDLQFSDLIFIDAWHCVQSSVPGELPSSIAAQNDDFLEPKLPGDGPGLHESIFYSYIYQLAAMLIRGKETEKNALGVHRRLPHGDLAAQYTNVA